MRKINLNKEGVIATALAVFFVMVFVGLLILNPSAFLERWHVTPEQLFSPLGIFIVVLGVVIINVTLVIGWRKIEGKW